MTPTQRHIGVLGVGAALFLLMYPPWKLEYESGHSQITFGYLFSPPTGEIVISNPVFVNGSPGPTEKRPLTQGVTVWMLLGELAVVAGLVAFLMWLYRPAGNATADPGAARPAPA